MLSGELGHRLTLLKHTVARGWAVNVSVSGDKLSGVTPRPFAVATNNDDHGEPSFSLRGLSVCKDSWTVRRESEETRDRKFTLR